MKQTYKIVFRAVKSGEHKGSVDCIFLDCFERDYSLACYAHIGQHGVASMDYVYNNTRPAKPAEYQSLLNELEGIYQGDNLEVLDKLPALSSLIGEYRKAA